MALDIFPREGQKAVVRVLLVQCGVLGSALCLVLPDILLAMSQITMIWSWENPDSLSFQAYWVLRDL